MEMPSNKHLGNKNEQHLALLAIKHDNSTNNYVDKRLIGVVLRCCCGAFFSHYAQQGDDDDDIIILLFFFFLRIGNQSVNANREAQQAIRTKGKRNEHKTNTRKH